MQNPTTQYYDQNVKNEWNRLFVSPYRRIEFEVVHHYISKYLYRLCRILDLGGGPGRYTISLAKQGHRLTLVDLSHENIQFAKQKIMASDVQNQVEGTFVGDACKLEMVQNQSFDSVLCMGPLYHLVERGKRIQCLHECKRVLKQNSPLFVTFVPRTTYLRDILRSGTFVEFAKHTIETIEEINTFGTSVTSRVPNMYFCRIEEIPELFHEAGFELLELVSTYGFVAFMDDKIEEISKDPESWKTLIQFVLSTCTDPNALSVSEHILAIAKKR